MMHIYVGQNRIYLEIIAQAFTNFEGSPLNPVIFSVLTHHFYYLNAKLTLFETYL